MERRDILKAGAGAFVLSFLGLSQAKEKQEEFKWGDHYSIIRSKSVDNTNFHMIIKTNRETFNVWSYPYDGTEDLWNRVDEVRQEFAEEYGKIKQYIFIAHSEHQLAICVSMWDGEMEIVE